MLATVHVESDALERKPLRIWQRHENASFLINATTVVDRSGVRQQASPSEASESGWLAYLPD